eukprot:3028378-Prymnesium_polylepis.1
MAGCLASAVCKHALVGRDRRHRRQEPARADAALDALAGARRALAREERLMRNEAIRAGRG